MPNRRDFLTSSIGAAAFSCSSAPAASRPNLVFVFPDQMRGSAMGFLGEEPVQTPRLDAFARESLVLTEAASIYPVCSPYRAMLMSGCYPQRSKVVSNCTNHSYAYGVELPREQRCWSDVLAAAGYELGYIGKWHLEGPKEPYVESYNNLRETKWNEWTPPERRHGFGFWHAYNTFDRHMTPQYWTTEMGRDERLKIEQWGPQHEVDTAIKYLRNEGGAYRDSDKPFALVISMNPPHTPYHLFPEHYREAYSEVSDKRLFERPNIPAADTELGDYYRKNIRNYFSMITGVDDQFGRLLDELDSLGLSGDTIVVFTSDHGDCVGIHRQPHKNNHFEESMRVPFLIRWPGKIRPRSDDLLFSNTDICPTLLGLLGESIPNSIQGESRAALFRTGEGVRPEAQPYMKMPYRNPLSGRRGLRTDRYTLMVDKAGDEQPLVELYDRGNDPYQLANLASGELGLVSELLEEGVRPWLDQAEDGWA